MKNEGQKILISDYIDNIISLLYPLTVPSYLYPFCRFASLLLSSHNFHRRAAL